MQFRYNSLNNNNNLKLKSVLFVLKMTTKQQVFLTPKHKLWELLTLLTLDSLVRFSSL